jgi:hypothetical protein
LDAARTHRSMPVLLRHTVTVIDAGSTLLELVGSLEVGIAGLAVDTGVVFEVEKLGEHPVKSRAGAHLHESSTERERFVY